MKKGRKNNKFIIITTILLIFVLQSTVFASPYGGITNVNLGQPGTRMKNSINIIIGVIQIIGVSIAVIILIILGSKYMMAAPSARAEIKKHLFIYLIGSLLFFGATGVLQLIQGFAGEI